MTQKQFAQSTNLTHSQINRFVRGHNAGLGTLETIARNLPQPQRASVVAAWLRDALPESASGLVGIATDAPRIAESAEQLRRELNPECEAAIRFLGEQACRHTEISDLLIDLAKALKGTR
jgi:hypothetical protein